MSKAGTQDSIHGAMPQPVHLARRAARYWRTSVVVFGAVLAAGLFVATRTKQVYRSESVLLHRSTPRTGSSSNDGNDSSKRVGARLQDMLMAHDRLKRIIAEQKLFPDAPNPQHAVDEMKKKVGFRVRDGSTFQISFDGNSPKEVQAVTASLARSLIDDYRRNRGEEAVATAKMYDEQHKRASEDVSRKAAALEAFLQTNPDAIPQPRGPAMATNTGDLASVQMELERLRAGGTGAARGAEAPRADTALVAEQRRTEAALAKAQADLDARLQRYTDEHPDVVAARETVKQAQLAMLKTQAQVAGVPQPETTPQAGASSAAKSAETERQISLLERRLRGMRTSGSTLLGPRVTPRMAQLQVQLQSLQYDLQQARERLADIEDKQSQSAMIARLESGGQLGQLVVLDPAYLPGLPLVDVKKKVALASFAAALMLAVAFAVLRALTDDRIFDRRDAEWMTSRPVLAYVPVQRRRRITARV